MANFICDLGGQSFQDLDGARNHLQAVHQVDDAAELGSMEQNAGILTLRNSGEETVIDLDQWLTENLRAQDDASHVKTGQCLMTTANPDPLGKLRSLAEADRAHALRILV